jgi:hypothetical protein
MMIHSMMIADVGGMLSPTIMAANIPLMQMTRCHRLAIVAQVAVIRSYYTCRRNVARDMACNDKFG